jgi:hypothetical protein
VLDGDSRHPHLKSVSATEKPGSVTVKSYGGPRPKWTAERERQFALVELFQFEHGGRFPEEGDGEAWEALQSLRGANLQAEAVAPAQPWETTEMTAWRKRTAVKLLAHLPGLSRTTAPRTARPREASAAPARRRGGAVARGGDSGDRPRPSEADLAARLRRASWRGGAR